MDMGRTSSEAEDALAEMARIRSTTRGIVNTLSWQTSVLWGLIFLIAVLTWVSLSNDLVSTLYWFVTIPIGIAVTWRLESALPRLHDAGSSPTSFWVISAAMAIGAFGTWFVFDERPSTLIWFTVLLAGFAAFALVDRQHWMVAGIAVLWLWGVAVWLSTGDSRADLDLTLALFSTAIGAGLLGIGFGQRLGRPR